MVQIPPSFSTVDAIYQHYSDYRKDWRRPHLGASQIGKPCDRELWYQFRWAAEPEFPGRILRLFDTGNLEESRLVADLRNIGVEVYDRDPNAPARQIRYSDPNGHFAGSLDGVGRGFIEAPKTWHVLEFKTSNTNNFKKIKGKGVKLAKPEHYAQMQVYMRWSGLKRAFYFCVCKDTDEIYSERVYAAPKVADELTARANRIIFATDPPKRFSEGGSQSSGPCRFCTYRPVCLSGQAPVKSCRSCVHGAPLPSGGAWECERDNRELTFAEQETGCERYERRI